MQMKSALFALALTVTAAPLAAQIVVRDPREPSSRRPTSGSTIGDIIFGDGTVNRGESCRVRDARTPDGRIVQICDDRRRGDDDDDAYENRRDGRGRRAHVNDMDGDGDFDARDRAIRKRQKELAKQQKKRGGDDWVMSSRRGR
jgi:hypothetical protein